MIFSCCLYISAIFFSRAIYICHLFSVAFFCTVFFSVLYSVLQKYSIEKESYLETGACFRNPWIHLWKYIYIFIKRARVCLFLEVGSWSLLVQVECRSQQSVSDCQSCNCRFLHVGFPLVSEVGLVNPLFPCCIQGGQTCDCENTAVSLWLVVEQRGQSCQNILSGMLSCSWLRFWDLLVAIYAKI